MPATIHIEGLDDCLRCMDAAPGNVLEMVQGAFRDASKKTARQIRMKTPAKFRRLVRYKVFQGQISGNTNVLIGLFNVKKRKDSGDEVFDWFKAYWKNYGTLQNRDPNHDFVYPVKRNVKRRNNVGQMPERFFEAAIAGWEQPFFDNFQEALKQREDQLYNR